MIGRALFLATAVASALFGGTAVATARPAGSSACADPSITLTVEEKRLTKAVPGKILRASGADAFAATFAADLCSLTGADQAREFTRVRGQALWQWAVDRAQRQSAAGLAAGDDRPLYWARLGLTSALRQWIPEFPLDKATRLELITTLDRGTRGHDTIEFGGVPGRRVIVTGFDPFTLDQEIRGGNPSGAIALALDGQLLDTPSGPVRVEAALFPVLWDPFAEGMVERALLPHMDQVNLLATVSQGRPGRFDVERYNGRWRGGYGDNNNISRQGIIPIPAGIPTVTPAPEFVATTLPYQSMVNAGTGPYQVVDNTYVVEIPAGQTKPVGAPNGPTPGSTARQGGGGDYLSNEIAYRATLLRDAVKVPTPVGHLHTPVLSFDPANSAEITDPAFEANRLSIIGQARSLIGVAADGGGPASRSTPARQR